MRRDRVFRLLHTWKMNRSFSLRGQRSLKWLSSLTNSRKLTFSNR